MTWLSRFATAAVQRQITRLQLDYNRLAEKLQCALRDRDAAVERNHGHIRAAYQTAESITALVEAYNKLEQALETACAERDQAKADLLEANSKFFAVLPGQRYDLDNVADEKRYMDRGDE